MGVDKLANIILIGANETMAKGKEVGNTTTWAMELQLLSEHMEIETVTSAICEEGKHVTLNESIADTVVIELNDKKTNRIKLGV